MIRIWSREGHLGTEFADIPLFPNSLAASGVAIVAEPIPYRLHYRLRTAPGYVTTRLRVGVRGDTWRRGLDLYRDASGLWSCTTESEGNPDLPPPGGDLAAVMGALDCDLGLCPLTNSMPVLRHRLHEGGGPLDFLMVWVSVPDLAVHASRQRYTFLRREASARIVRFESLDSDFVADLVFDEHGIVCDYPGLARRIA